MVGKLVNRCGIPLDTRRKWSNISKSSIKQLNIFDKWDIAGQPRRSIAQCWWESRRFNHQKHFKIGFCDRKQDEIKMVNPLKWRKFIFWVKIMTYDGVFSDGTLFIQNGSTQNMNSGTLVFLNDQISMISWQTSWKLDHSWRTRIVSGPGVKKGTSEVRIFTWTTWRKSTIGPVSLRHY